MTEDRAITDDKAHALNAAIRDHVREFDRLVEQAARGYFISVRHISHALDISIPLAEMARRRILVAGLVNRGRTAA
jgi:hypothetical protein